MQQGERGSAAFLMHSHGVGVFVRGDILGSFGVKPDGRFRFKALARAINISLPVIALAVWWRSNANHFFQRLDTPGRVIDFGHALHQYVHTLIFLSCHHFSILPGDLQKTDVIGTYCELHQYLYHDFLFAIHPFTGCGTVGVKRLLPYAGIGRLLAITRMEMHCFRTAIYRWQPV